MQYKFPETASKDFSIIKLRNVSAATGIEYMKIYNAINGKYSSLTDSERTRIYNYIISEAGKACNALGFTIDGKRIRLKD